jgi:hypothetical protein
MENETEETTERSAVETAAAEDATTESETTGEATTTAAEQDPAAAEPATEQSEPAQPGTEAAILAALAGEVLAAVRELVLKAHPDVVPELITGSTVAELTASIEPARAAFQRIAERLGTGAGQGTAAAPPPVVPAGGAPPVVVDPDTMTPEQKIRSGVEAQRRAADRSSA